METDTALTISTLVGVMIILALLAAWSIAAIVWSKRYILF